MLGWMKKWMSRRIIIGQNGCDLMVVAMRSSTSKVLHPYVFRDKDVPFIQNGEDPSCIRDLQFASGEKGRSRDLPAYDIFANAEVPYFGVVCLEPQ